MSGATAIMMMMMTTIWMKTKKKKNLKTILISMLRRKTNKKRGRKPLTMRIWTLRAKNQGMLKRNQKKLHKMMK